MKLRGDQLKTFRKNKGLSQKQLAQGICTQATISLIEKNNKVPGMTILAQLCARLGISLAQILVDENQVLTDVFTTIDRLILQKQYDAATDQLNNIGIKQLQSRYDKQRYYYFLGMLQLEQNKDYDEALFNFELVLQQFSVADDDIYQIMTTIAVGTAWFYKDDGNQAKKFANQASELLQVNVSINDARQLIASYVSLAQLYQLFDDTGTTLELVNHALELCRHNETLFLLDEVYLKLANCYFAMGQVETAKANWQIAASVATINEHTDLAEQIKQQLLKLN